MSLQPLHNLIDLSGGIFIKEGTICVIGLSLIQPGDIIIQCGHCMNVFKFEHLEYQVICPYCYEEFSIEKGNFWRGPAVFLEQKDDNKGDDEQKIEYPPVSLSEAAGFIDFDNNYDAASESIDDGIDSP